LKEVPQLNRFSLFVVSSMAKLARVATLPEDRAKDLRTVGIYTVSADYDCDRPKIEEAIRYELAVAV
jgi:hypothetical protein